MIGSMDGVVARDALLSRVNGERRAFLYGTRCEVSYAASCEEQELSVQMRPRSRRGLLPLLIEHHGQHGLTVP